MATDFRAFVTPAGGLTIDGVYQQNGVTPPATPGNVGVCLSGGGSRAMSAGKGQLQALAQLGLLGKVKALSTVSGGGWCGVPYVYVNDASISDAMLLGTYVDPSQLTTATIGSLPPQTIGSGVTSWFSIPDLLLEALKFYLEGVPSNELWQTLIGNHILSPVGLNANSAHLPTGWFTYNDATQAAITGPPLNNAGLPNPVIQVASGSNRIQRPYSICNFGLLLNQPADDLAPVQATPFFTGVMTAPQAGVADDNGNAPGGGGVTSFAFHSLYAGGGANQVSITQARPNQWQFTLVDAAGTSSAAFAATISDYAREWLSNPAKALAEISQLLAKRPARAMGVLSQLPKLMMLAGAKKLPKIIEDALQILTDIVPQYWYWPPANPSATVTQPDEFADGGSLENAGINGLLAYGDISSVLAFINSSQPIVASPCGVIDPNGGFVPGTCFEIDDTIPPLFGYQPYQAGIGYQLYSATSNPSNPAFSHNQVFDSSLLSTLIVALSQMASQGLPTVFQQSLQVLPNPWFGIAGGNRVTVMWFYLNPTPTWTAQLVPEVRAVLPSSFPNYNTFTMLELTPQQVNLLTNFAAWTVVQSKGPVQALFQ